MENKINSYLTFKLNKETFGTNVKHVLNILEPMKITKIPAAPDYMPGVVNLRGEVLPIIDTKYKFGMGKTEFTGNTCILVIEIENEEEYIKVGALADGVEEVLELNEDDLKPPPSIGSKFNSRIIESMAKVDEEFIMILNVAQIFSEDELVTLQNAVGDEKVKSEA